MCIRDSSYRSFDTNFIPLNFCDKGLRMNALEEFEIYRGHNNPVYKLSLIHILRVCVCALARACVCVLVLVIVSRLLICIILIVV